MTQAQKLPTQRRHRSLSISLQFPPSDPQGAGSQTRETLTLLTSATQLGERWHQKAMTLSAKHWSIAEPLREEKRKDKVGQDGHLSAVIEGLDQVQGRKELAQGNRPARDRAGCSP